MKNFTRSSKDQSSLDQPQGPCTNPTEAVSTSSTFPASDHSIHHDNGSAPGKAEHTAQADSGRTTPTGSRAGRPVGVQQANRHPSKVKKGNVSSWKHLYSNIDGATITMTARFIPDQFLDELERVQSIAKQFSQNIPFNLLDSSGEEIYFVMYPHGAKNGYKYFVKTHNFVLK